MQARLNARLAAVVLGVVGTLGLASQAQAHCDTPEGPVIPAVHQALEAKDLTPALRWIKPEYEGEIKAAFSKALSVRESGGAARELADAYFTETFVRLHRAGEGEPYTGIKPAGTEPSPAVKAADAALKSGNDETLVKLMQAAVGDAVHERFTKAKEALAHANHSVDAGREYVEAYVGLVHFAEHVHGLAQAPAHVPAHAGSAKEAGAAHAPAPAATHDQH